MEKIIITKDNVKELWEMYEEYKNWFYENFYSDVRCIPFEEYVDEYFTECQNCHRYIHKSELGTSELALQDNICEDCMQDGYGL